MHRFAILLAALSLPLSFGCSDDESNDDDAPLLSGFAPTIEAIPRLTRADIESDLRRLPEVDAADPVKRIEAIATARSLADRTHAFSQFRAHLHFREAIAYGEGAPLEEADAARMRELETELVDEMVRGTDAMFAAIDTGDLAAAGAHATELRKTAADPRSDVFRMAGQVINYVRHSGE